MALEEKLTNDFGALADVVQRFKPGSWRTSAEICKERITAKGLRYIWFWTANFGMYTVEDGEEFLYFGGREANPVFSNISEAVRQLREEHDYKLSAEEIQLVKSSVQPGHTVKVKLSDLGLIVDKIVDDNEWAHFSIDVANWQAMNAAQKSFAERIYGSMKERESKTGQKTSDFAEYMAELKKAGKESVNVYVLSQEYVRSHVPEGSAVARACWLGSFDGSSNFSAGCRVVDNSYFALRGVLLVEAAEGGGAQKVEQKVDYASMAKPFNAPASGVDAVLLGQALNKDGAKFLADVLGAYVAQKQ